MLWIGASTTNVGGSLGQEEVNRDVVGGLGHVELATWFTVNPCPHSAILRDLPSIRWKLFSGKVAHQLVSVLFFFIGRHFFAASLVALGEVNKLCHASLANVGQSLLGSVQRIPWLFSDILDGWQA